MYVHELHNAPLAESYCNRFYQPDNPDTRDLFLMLAKVFVRPPPTVRSVLLLLLLPPPLFARPPLLPRP